MKPVDLNGEKFSFPGANIKEFSVWGSIRRGPYKDASGEVVAISESGKYLVMEKLVNIDQSEHHATPSLPDWVDDLKPINFGKTDAGRIKTRDYGLADVSPALNKAKTGRWSWQGPESKR
jgi:hypothetical protein